MVEEKIIDEEYLKVIDEKIEMIPLTFDVVLKSVFTKNQDLLKKFLLSVLKLNFDPKTTKIRISNTELVKQYTKESQKRVDILVVINDVLYVDIEANRSPFKRVKRRNTMYLDKINTLILEVGEKMKKANERFVYQLNLNAVDKTFDLPDDVVGLCSLKTKKVYDDNKLILLKYLVYYREKYYNKDKEKTEDEIWLAALTAENFTELNEILSHILTDEERNRFVRSAIEMSQSEFNLAEWEAEKLNQMVIDDTREEGREEGREETLKETIINMLKKEIPIKTISEITNKTLEEIEELRKQI